MIKHFVKLVIPSIITSVGAFMVMTINTIFAGKIVDDTAAKLAGVGLGSLMLSMIARYILIGVNCAQETLVSQAFGQREFKLSGVYLIRGFFIMTVVYIPLAVCLCFANLILLFLRQNEGVVGYAQEYIYPMIPALYFFGLFDLVRKFLQCLQYPQAPMIA